MTITTTMPTPTPIDLFIDKLLACANDRTKFQTVLTSCIELCIKQSKQMGPRKPKDTIQSPQIVEEKKEKKDVVPKPAKKSSHDDTNLRIPPKDTTDATESHGPNAYHQFRKQVAQVGFNSAACVYLWSMCHYSKKSSLTEAQTQENMDRWNELVEQFHTGDKDKTIFLEPFGLVPEEHYNSVKRTYTLKKKATTATTTQVQDKNPAYQAAKGRRVRLSAPASGGYTKYIKDDEEDGDGDGEEETNDDE